MTADEVATRMRRQYRSHQITATTSRSLRLSDLEPRLLFSATPIDPAAFAGGDEAATVVQVETVTDQNSGTSANETITVQTNAEPSDKRVVDEIILIDSSVPDIQLLLDDLSESRPNASIYVLLADRDGVDQISEILEGHSDLSSVHIVSHAEDQAVKLGATWLGQSNLEGYAGQLASWQSALSNDADILFYGCDLASGESGRTLIDSLSALTGADVAASDDDTGYADFGADWDLEYYTGEIESAVAFSTELQQNWVGKLSTITVDTFADEVTANGFTSLREAIAQATAGDTIVLGAGTYNLTIDTLDINKNLTITGSDARSTTIDGSALGKRVFELQGSSVVTMSSMTIQGGNEDKGGGILVDESSVLNLSDALLQNNSSNDGGAIYVKGTANLQRVLLFDNDASGKGGAINFDGADGGSLTNVTMSGNTANNDGGALFTDTNITITNSTITLNTGDKGGGVVNNGAVVTISNTIIAGNTGISTDPDVMGDFSSDGSNLIQTVGSATGFGGDITGTNPNLGALTNNGGETDTHAITTGSAAYNAGTATGAPAVDQRGVARDGSIDIGAFEYSTLANNAPVLDSTKSPTLTAINEDAGAPAGAVGTLVSQLVDLSSPSGQLDNVTDVDASPSLGIAITGADATNGDWWYSTDNGSTWSTLGAVSGVSARLLAADAATRLYFQPNANWNGSIANAITFRAWDQTQYAVDSLADTSVNGGATAFSAATDTASLVISAINDAPENSLPPAQTVMVGLAKTFNAANGNLISISDIDANSGSMEVTLNATKGVVSLSGVTGLSFSDGDGTSDISMTFSGTIAEINAALDGLSFTGTANGEGSLQIVTNDMGNTGIDGAKSDDDSVAININPFLTVLDQFNSNTFSGNDGAVDWSTSWQEIGEGNGVSAGNVQINTQFGAQGIQFWQSGKGAMRQADLSGFTTATLSFDYARFGLDDAGDFIVVEASSNGGGSWSELDRFEGPANDGALQSTSYDISSFIASNTQIRFVTNGMNATESLFVDNVQIQYGVVGPVGAVTDTDTGANQVDEDSANGTAVGVTAFATDSSDTVTYSLDDDAGGRFEINSTTGVVTVSNGSLLNYEVTTSHDITVRATSSDTSTATEVLTINVLPVNESSPEITSNGGGATASINVSENHTAVTIVVATDADAPAQTLTYSISGGADAAKFTINDSSGELSFIAAPDFETPTDVGGDNVYDVIVEVTDGTLTDSQAIAVTVNNSVESGLPSNSILISTDENVTSSGAPGLSEWDAGEIIEFGSITSLDPVAGTTGGSFASLFNLTSFAQDGAADIESLHYVTEAITIGNTTTYDLQAGDVLFATRDIETLISTNTLPVTRNDLIVFRPDATGDYSSGTFTILLKNPVSLGFHAVTLITQDTLVGDVTLSKGSFLLAHTDSLQHHKIQYYTPDNVGAVSTTGTLQTLIDESSILSGQLQGLDLIENSVTLGGHTLNVGEILVSVKDGGTVGSNNVVVTGNDIFSISVTTTDLGSPSSNFTATLVLDGSDVGLGSAAEQIFGFSLTSATTPPNQAPVITSDGGAATAAVNVSENTLTVTTVAASDADLPTQSLSYSIVGGDDAAKFTINNATGVLSFLAVPDFEAPTDTGGNNIYDVTVQVSDGSLTDTQSIAVTVTAVNDNAPAITSNGGGANAAINVTENTTSVTTVMATDDDLPGQTLTYSISGTDAAKFSINSSSGELRFIAPPNFEDPEDEGDNNVYYLTVQSSDGTFTDNQNLAVTVTDADEALTASNEYLVNDEVGDQQVTSAEDRGSTRAVSMAADGSYVVVWTSLNQDGSGKGVYAQRFAADGTAITTEFRVNETPTNDQQWASVSSAFDGTFVVTWTSNQGATGDDIYYRRFAANGTALTGELVANTSTSGVQKNSVIGMNTFTGEFVIAWQGNGTQSGETDSAGIFAQRFDSSGAAVGSEFRVNTATSGTQYDAAIAMNTEGDFVIVWDDTVGVHFQLFDDDGNEQGGQVTVASSLYAGNADVAMQDDGSFVVVWRQSGAITPSDVYLQRYNQNGSTSGSTESVATTSSFDQVDPSIAIEDDGRFIVVWEGYGSQTGQSDSYGIFGQRFHSNGNLIGSEFRVNESTSGTQSKASVAMLDVDNFVVVWSGAGDQTGQADTSGVFARQYGTAGVNSAPTVTLTNQLASLAEDADTGSSIKIADIVITDDGNGTNELSLTGDDAAMFEIVGGNELHLKAGATLDYETNPSLDVTVRVDDSQIGVTFDDSDSLAVAISDVNEAPTVALSNPVTTLSEDADTSSGSTKVADITVTDDAMGTNVLSLTGDDAAMFEIVGGNELHLKAGVTLDFEANPSLDVNVEVDDTDLGATFEDSDSLAITISNVNEAPTVTLTPVVATLAEDADTTSAIVVATITVNDDALGTNSLSLSGDDAGLFEIVGSDLRLVAGASLDFETNPALDVNVVVDDSSVGGTPDDTKSYSVSVTDSNESPTLTITPVITTTPENTDTSSSMKVATVAINDDALGTNNLTLTGDDASFFELQAGGTELHLKAGVTLDFETNPSLDVTVLVDDATLTGSPDDSQSFTLTIQDANDPATGTPSISGTLKEGETLVVDTSDIADEDGLGAFNYQWTRDGDAIGGANASTYTLVSADVGSEIRVEVSFSDGNTNSEGPIVSGPTGVIVAANQAPSLDDYQTTAVSGHSKSVAASVFKSLASDPEGAPLSAVLVSGPISGTLSLHPSGAFTYTSTAGFVGRVTFQWMANDGTFDSNVATVTIEVFPVVRPTVPTSPVVPESDGGSEGTNNSNEEPAESDSGSSESESDSESDSSSESSDGESQTPMQSGVPNEAHSESQPGQNTESVNVVEVVIQTQSESRGEPASPTDALLKQLSESFSTESTRISRESFDAQSESSAPLSDYQTRNLVMADFALMTRPGAMWDQLDSYQKNVDSRIQGDLIVVGSAGAAASSFTVGVVAWAMRSGFLVSGLIAHMPAWSGVDPLLIMNGLSGTAAGGDAASETLEELMDRQNREVQITDD
ncbi:DUF4347 domain-containing protein [Aporhodopirellula aestuarii]|uniref:DUF4347 domain-containing protein n=1 Tax=Aporhodopirellula aestuarii TaxID=2950107 RepID=A0ABT0U7E2_9BACT|nr:DUF4347 domain-containing protein [Aporhodopirellula aestuarii]MCM2372825.1 DUF4347 domain-containing protein [Aporhodopirellula aestuarii]